MEGQGGQPETGKSLVRVTVSLKNCRTALNRSGIPGMDYCLNPYTGCAHACLYCYAACMKRLAGPDRRWGTFVEVKANFAARLAAELRRRRRGRVMLASVTDAYQPAEERFALTRTCLEILAESPLEVAVLTKSDLVVRDVDLLSRLPRASVGFSLTVADDALARLLEPGAPPTSARLAALASLSRAGVQTWAFIAPVIPGLGDTAENLARLVRAAYAAGAQQVSFDPLNFYPTAVANLERLLARHFPRRLDAFRAARRDPAAYRWRLHRLFEEINGSLRPPAPL